MLRCLRKPQRKRTSWRKAASRRPLHHAPRRRDRRSGLTTVLLVALILFGAFYVAKNQGWIHVGRGGRITVPHISLGRPPASTAQAPPRLAAGHCDRVLMRHVYHPRASRCWRHARP